MARQLELAEQGARVDVPEGNARVHQVFVFRTCQQAGWRREDQGRSGLAKRVDYGQGGISRVTILWPASASHLPSGEKVSRRITAFGDGLLLVGWGKLPQVAPFEAAQAHDFLRLGTAPCWTRSRMRVTSLRRAD